MMPDQHARSQYCECGQCEDCSDDPIECRQADGTVRFLEKETREEWKARTCAKEVAE